MDLCRLNVLAKLIGLVSFYVGFGVLLTQLAVWQSCGGRCCVGTLCFVFAFCHCNYGLQLFVLV